MIMGSFIYYLKPVSQKLNFPMLCSEMKREGFRLESKCFGSGEERLFRIRKFLGQGLSSEAKKAS